MQSTTVDESHDNIALEEHIQRVSCIFNNLNLLSVVH